MKVMFINAVCGTGSTGTIVADLVETLRFHGDRGCVAYGVGTAQKVPPAEAVRFNTKAGYYAHNALSRFTDHAGLYSSAPTHRLVEEIEKFDPDVIHLHTLHGYYVNYEILFQYLAKANRQVIWTLHDCWAMTGHCTHFVTADCEKWKTSCHDCALLRDYPVCYTQGDVRRNFERKKAAFTSLPEMTIVTPSKWLADIAKRSFLGKYPVTVIPNGIDTDVFRPRKSTFRQSHDLVGKYMVLGVANVWSERKGLYDFYRLAARLPEKYQIVLVGLSEAQRKDLPRNIIGISRTSNTVELAEIYSAADIFVNPTYEETFGLTSIEAQACGTPVAAYSVGGCPETIQPGWGNAVPGGDIDELCARVIDWCQWGKKIPEPMPSLSKKFSCGAYYDLYRSLAEASSPIV